MSSYFLFFKLFFITHENHDDDEHDEEDNDEHNDNDSIYINNPEQYVEYWKWGAVTTTKKEKKAMKK